MTRNEQHTATPLLSVSSTSSYNGRPEWDVVVEVTEDRPENGCFACDSSTSNSESVWHGASDRPWCAASSSCDGSGGDLLRPGVPALNMRKRPRRGGWSSGSIVRATAIAPQIWQCRVAQRCPLILVPFTLRLEQAIYRSYSTQQSNSHGVVNLTLRSSNMHLLPMQCLLPCTMWMHCVYDYIYLYIISCRRPGSAPHW